ncbi:MAG: ribosome biosis GTPase [Clostridia bacterium]|nr:ribosome biosis GTPase [Clostridia bacterium]
MPVGIEDLYQYLKVVDVVLEVADARLPFTSRYPGLGIKFNCKKSILILNRMDLAEPQATLRWLEYYKSAGTSVLAINARSGEGIKTLHKELSIVAKQKNEVMKQKGLRERPLRIMVLGIPNVGKSSLLNRLAGRGVARTGDRPGITRGPQWIRLMGRMELLDTPGVLWPNWHGREKVLFLGAIGCIPDGRLPITEIAILLGELLKERAPKNLIARYNINLDNTESDILTTIGKARGFLMSGGEVDKEKTANAVVNDFREGKLGRFTLEYPVVS